ncbi:DUF2088 domain-containing protein [Ktedonosporobacter rubrisoli]|uniref:DUF2088 domain-containing protein n=1 Tax=Ktedonosporobacter rubrisoli TaxID=2509675 RepID=A0A4V0YYY4_KTERU|nr:lactate racemase domain-containing protein [Ktedonosporobacter rubrisoli]QBD77831.1 DUF2088 domain-containing protein [Ktedonosporobacter rubrisoli]
MNLQPYQDTTGLLKAVPLPDLVLLRQRFPRQRVQDVESTVVEVLEQASLAEKIRPGARIAIATGSRGIANIAEIIRTLVVTLRRYGADPFVIPAMGSHGGATAEGQRAVLASLDITEASVGAPIISSLEVDVLGKLPAGLPVYIDRVAHQADGIILVNRIKPHTDFNAPIESGLSKMLAIGLSKHAGALAVHSWGLEGLKHYVPEVAKYVVSHASILLGLAIVENAFDEVAEIAAVQPAGIGAEHERLLTQRAKDMMPRLPWDVLDVLVIDKMGKNISGAGMDTNIIGRLRSGEQKPTAARISNISVHDLTDESHGNAIGLGTADFVTAHLMSKVDFHSFYINVLTAGVIAVDAGKVPMVFSTDREAIAAALHTSGCPDPTKIRLARIESTLRLEYMLASSACLASLRPESKVEILGAAQAFPLDTSDTLIPFADLRMRQA